VFPDFNIYSTPLLLLSLQGLLFAALLLYRYRTSRSISDALLALILLITCYHQTSYTLGFMDWYDTYKNTKINYFLVPLSLGLAPLIYLYFLSITNPKKVSRKNTLVHFVLLLVLIFISLIILIYDSNQAGFSETQNGYLVINFKWKYLDPVVTLVSLLQMLVYLLLSFQLLHHYKVKINQYFSNTYKVELSWLRNFLIAYTVLYIYYTIQIVVNETIVNLSWIQEWWYYLLSGLVIIYVGIKGFYTDLSQLKGIEIESFLEQKSKIPIREQSSHADSTILSEKLIESKLRIEKYFETDKPFLEADLTLVILASKLSMSREELSESINKGFQQRFNDFINGYRIKEFIAKLKAGQHRQYSLIGIAYECGFNSKPTFNRAFKKFTSVSPSEYLKTVDFDSIS